MSGKSARPTGLLENRGHNAATDVPAEEVGEERAAGSNRAAYLFACVFRVFCGTWS